jgi:tryptophan synthase alpha chain
MTSENRIRTLFRTRQSHILSIYFTAGFPRLEDTRPVLRALEDAGVDLVEIGMPYSDPVADGETIQQSNQRALENGMTLQVLFEQLTGMRAEIRVPVILMGYLNPVLQFGIEAFCQRCREVGVDGLILPDLPLEVYQREFREVFERYGLVNVFLITPQTQEARIRQIDNCSDAFIYMVSSASVTGAKQGIDDAQTSYFKRIADMELTNPRLVGFGISNHETFELACQQAQGAIIGSAFVKLLDTTEANSEAISRYLREVRGNA